jgi:cyanate permease
MMGSTRTVGRFINPMEPDQTRYRWVMLSLLWLLYAMFGLGSRSIAPLVTPILRDLGITYAQMGMILGSWQLSYIMVSLAAGTLLDRWGVRKCLFAGALIMSFSLLIRCAVKDFAGMLFSVALFGAGAPMISIGCPKGISLWFHGSGRGTAVGVYVTGSYIGGLAVLTLTNSFVMPLMGYDWRLTFVCYGLVIVVAALTWWMLAKDISIPEDSQNPGIAGTFVKLIRIRKVRILLAMALLCFGAHHGFLLWLPKIFEAKGFSPVSAGVISAIPMAAAIPALLMIPRIVTPNFRGPFVALSALLTMGMTLLTVMATGRIQFAGLICYGFIAPTFLPILTLILMETPGVESRLMGTAIGLFFCVGEIGGFTGPLVMGVLVDVTGTFLAGAIFLSVLYVAISILTFYLAPSPSD